MARNPFERLTAPDALIYPMTLWIILFKGRKLPLSSHWLVIVSMLVAWILISQWTR